MRLRYTRCKISALDAFMRGQVSPKNLTGPHSGQDGQLNEQPLPLIEHAETKLNIGDVQGATNRLRSFSWREQQLRRIPLNQALGKRHRVYLVQIPPQVIDHGKRNLPHFGVYEIPQLIPLDARKGALRTSITYGASRARHFPAALMPSICG